MPKPIKFSYDKKAPFRDAFLFIIVCEGASREKEYFHFFDGMSSRVKIVPVTNEMGSAPKLLVEVAEATEKEWDANDERDHLWFVIDTDRWREQLHDIRKICSERPHWQVAQSNPCFEVWLYFHATAQLPQLEDLKQCKDWKPYLHKVVQGGFNSDFHPAAIEAAIVNAKAAYKETGYSPDPGSTQIWRLGEELLPLIKKDLDALKDKFPAPVIH